MVIPAHHLAGNRSNVSELDLYETPYSATKALMDRVKFEGEIWECACGYGAMARVLENYNPVVCSDIMGGEDFLTQTNLRCPNIVTNPPYKLAEQFLKKGIELGAEKVALFLRLNFLEGQGRYHLFKKYPPEWVLVFSKRQTLAPVGVVVKTGGTIAYAWFIWTKGYQGNPKIDWIL